MTGKIGKGDTVTTRDNRTGTVDRVYTSTTGDDKGLESAELTLANGESRRAFTSNLTKP
jgi:hypothetical protein